MIDEEFWALADSYERVNEEGQPYVPKSYAMALVQDIAEANDYDYDETLADLSLFSFGRTREDAPLRCISWIEEKCIKRR